MVAYVFGDYPLFQCILISTGLFQLCFFVCVSVSGLSDSLCLQAIINYRHVFSAQTSPSLPPLCDTGHIIILSSNKNASAILVLEEFLPLSSVSRLYQASLWWRLPLNAQKHKRKIHTCDECAGVSLWGRREDEHDSKTADWQHKAGWKDFERSCCLIKKCTLT